MYLHANGCKVKRIYSEDKIALDDLKRFHPEFKGTSKEIVAYAEEG